MFHCAPKPDSCIACVDLTLSHYPGELFHIVRRALAQPDAHPGRLAVAAAGQARDARNGEGGGRVDDRALGGVGLEAGDGYLEGGAGGVRPR